MRPYYFFLMMAEAYENIRNTRQWQGNLIRMQTAWMVNIQLAVDDRIKPEDLWRFDWDEQTETTEKTVTIETGLTDEEILAHNTRLAAMI